MPRVLSIDAFGARVNDASDAALAANVRAFNLALNALKQKGSPTGERPTIGSCDTEPMNELNNISIN